MAKQDQPDSGWQKDLLASKLEIPLLRSRIVRRKRLTRRFQEGMERSVTLIVAPTGYGKTTLLSELIPILSLANWRTAWVSLDSFDNLPIGFWMYLSASLQKAIPQFRFDPQQLLHDGGGLDEIRVLNPFFNAIAQIPHQVCLILDDYQFITNDDIHHSLGYFVEHLPTNLHLILASRTCPPIALSRLRAQGQITEITAEDLTFHLDEAQVFLNSVMGLNVDFEQVARLVNATEGWIAGLQLAALSAQGRKDLQFLDTDLWLDRRQVSDYLLEAVLKQLDAET